MRRPPLLLLALLVLAPACGTSPDGPAAFQAPAAASTLLPDGSVPWVDEVISEQDVTAPSPTSPPRGSAKPCRAAALTAVLPTWFEQGDGGEEGVRRPTPGLFGVVEVRLVGSSPCTLQGEVTGRLRIAGSPAPVRYAEDNVNEEGLRRLTVVTPEAPASLRVDWSPPYCGPTGDQLLRLELPDSGGTLDAPVTTTRTPRCSSRETEGDIRTYVSVGAFDQLRAPTVPSSPLEQLTASVERTPTSVRAGQPADFVVRLTNPTSSDVALDPCPGYVLQRFVLSTGQLAGFNTTDVYRLNCRAATVVPARGSVAFQVRAVAPDEPPGPELSVTWRLIAPDLAGRDSLSTGWTAPIAP